MLTIEVVQDVPVVAPDRLRNTSRTAPRAPLSVQEEGIRLWLERVVAAPNAWRSRATAAGGLLSAAAAASLAGLLAATRAGLDESVALAVAIAAVSFVGAVVALLLASVWGSPSIDTATEDFVNTLEDYYANESRPIRRIVYAGAALGAAAVCSTATAALLVVFSDFSRSAQVTFIDPAARSAALALCPDLRVSTPARVEYLDGNLVAVTLPAGGCTGGGTGYQLIIPRNSVALLLPEAS